MYKKCGGVAAYRVVCIGFMLVERPSVCVLASTVDVVHSTRVLASK